MRSVRVSRCAWPRGLPPRTVLPELGHMRGWNVLPGFGLHGAGHVLHGRAVRAVLQDERGLHGRQVLRFVHAAMRDVPVPVARGVRGVAVGSVLRRRIVRSMHDGDQAMSDERGLHGGAMLQRAWAMRRLPVRESVGVRSRSGVLRRLMRNNMRTAFKHVVVLGVVGTALALGACGGGGSSSGGAAGSGGVAGSGGEMPGIGGMSATGGGGTGGSTGGSGGGVSGSGGTGGQQPVAGAVGAPCSTNGDCDSGVCQTNGHCTAPCTSASDCPAGPAWSCAPITGHGMQCQCSQATTETCDGFDEDCDGIADNGATCAQAGYACVNGSCECVDKCNAVCTDLKTDASNCGVCGKSCDSGQVCQNGACVVLPCSGKCGLLEECFQDQTCLARSVAVTGGYSIDATEVTRAQYEAWLSTTPSTGGQPSYCSWNTDYTPDSQCEGSGSVCQSSGCGQNPQVCVDWCDAYAYCKAVGKRLCGKIGGGANAYGDYADATKSQWFNACSSGGQNVYPYGDTYKSQACKGEGSTTVPAGSLSTCQSSVSGYTGVYDLSGNVWEWEDSCLGNSGQSDNCRLRGGSFHDFDYVALRCDSVNNYFSRGSSVGNVGFRCCAP